MTVSPGRMVAHGSFVDFDAPTRAGWQHKVAVLNLWLDCEQDLAWGFTDALH